LLLIALRIFVEQGVEVAICEAGIGGYNDATHQLPGLLSVITTIGLDHHRELGPTLASVAADKAGIAGDNSTLILGPAIPPDLRGIIERDVEPRGVTLYQATRQGITATPLGVAGFAVELPGENAPLRFTLPLPGAFQLDNLATVVAALEFLGEALLPSVAGPLPAVAKERPSFLRSPAPFLRSPGGEGGRGVRALAGLEQTFWPGRLEYLPGRPGWLLDGAHNAHAFQAVAAALDGLVAPEERVVLYGAAEGKDYAACLPYLAQIAGRAPIYLVEGFYRAVPVARLREAVACAGAFASLEEAVQTLAHTPAHQDKTVIVIGSLFMMGGVRDYLYTSGFVL
jgi:dihydrofolate synthase/folylpolyglutamate synthase